MTWVSLVFVSLGLIGTAAALVESARRGPSRRSVTFAVVGAGLCAVGFALSMAGLLGVGS